MLKIKQNVDIGEYQELKAFKKKKMFIEYRAEKSKILSAKEVEQYLNKAPNDTCLARKVALIFGILGACRKDELVRVKTSHPKTYFEPEDTDKKQPMLLVRLPDTKTHEQREFTIKGKFYELCKQYSKLRPTKTPHNRFFVNFQKGKCTVQPIGMKKFGSMPRQVAEFLKLPNTESYTGHAFRRTSATLLAGGGADITAPKRYGGWKSTSVTEGYVESSLLRKGKICDQITNSIHLGPSTSNQPPLKQNVLIRKTEDLPSTSTRPSSAEKKNSNPSVDVVTSDEHIILNISGCSNCSFNILDKN